uniref:UBC core domain-containing protein n=1 Tax=Rhabditophanes sp. KR3021 TaxID=114890 RepID=A0AC35UC74_9BILA
MAFFYPLNFPECPVIYSEPTFLPKGVDKDLMHAIFEAQYPLEKPAHPETGKGTDLGTDQSNEQGSSSNSSSNEEPPENAALDRNDPQTLRALGEIAQAAESESDGVSEVSSDDEDTREFDPN